MGGTTTARSRARTVLAALAILTLVGVAVPLVARLTGAEAGPLAIMVALMPWVALASLVPVALAVAARAWPVLAAAVAAAVLCWWWQVPLMTADQALGDDALRAGTLNVTFGGADADAVVALVRDQQLDLLALQELTPAAERSLREAGLDDLLPYSEVRAEDGFTGTGLWSSAPLEDAGGVDGFTSRVVTATVALGGERRTVIVAHPMAPAPLSNRLWRAELDALAALVAGTEGPVLLAGDLNATRDHAGLRALAESGCVDAADQAGAGFVPTFPEGRGPFPVAAIDHVYSCGSHLRATSVTSVAVSGADHRALVAVYGTS